MQEPVVRKLVFPEEAYEKPLIEIDSDGRGIFVISDLHLAAGINSNNNYEGTENFFADQSFVRFIDHLEEKATAPKALLVINGDFIDFLRICDYPTTDNDFADWEEMLSIVGIPKKQKELRGSIIKKEKTFGLRTNDYKSVWKLHVCISGHQALFERLALWVYHGHRLIITKGNHDLEWYWKPVQNYLRYALARRLSQTQHLPVDDVLPLVNDLTIFADHAMIIDKKIYIEHGHCYERTTAVQGNILSANKQELNLPFGSFFNRYLINKIELLYPFIDNVRPRQNILLVLFRERFPLALKMVFYYVPFTVLLVPKKMWWEIFKYAITFLLIIILPLAITGFAIYKSLPRDQHPSDTSWLLQQALNTGKNLGFLLLSYLFGRLMTLVKLSGPSSFVSFAEAILHKNPSLQIVTFGHTHNPEQKNLQGRWYFNTGTWMPVFEASSADIRIDKTYTFLQVEHAPAGELIIYPLQRWNDDALRTDTLPLVDNDRS
jgi:UDP-2,3-diacylglucosamine pyrophosphatase LpxH